MTETDLVARLRQHKDFAQALRRHETAAYHAEAADRIERQSTALTASQETIDNLRKRIADLEDALEAIERGDDSIDGMAADIARAALHAEKEPDAT